MVTSDNKLAFDLYHGTSTLFLDSIIENGLGGVNPVKSWNLVELSEEVYHLSDKYLQASPVFKTRELSFKNMSEQAIHGNLNFQHGDPYLSASMYKAGCHAIKMRYGSEILTYTIDLINELLRLKGGFDSAGLYKRYPKLVDMLKTNPSPILIQARNIEVSILVSEDGNDPKLTLDRVKDIEALNTFSQVTNFRLTSPIQKDKLKFWLINVQEWNGSNPSFNLYEIIPESVA